MLEALVLLRGGYVVVVNGEAVQKVLDSAGRERR
jgi:hypothetical protein